MTPLRPGNLGRALALLLLAWPAAAASNRSAAVRPGPVFAPVSAGWAKPLNLPLVGIAASGQARRLAPFLKLDLNDPIQRRALSPIVHQLEKVLDLTPEKLAALPEDQQRGVLQMAADEAVEALQLKVAALAGDAGGLVWAKSLDKDQRADLFRVVAELQEIRAHYGAYLDQDARELMDMNYAQASARAYEVRQDLIAQVSGSAAQALEAKGTPSARAPPAAPIVLAAEPTSNAVKIIADMENNQQGWSSKELETAYLGYGFVREEGGSHIKYKHPVFPQLYATVAHKRKIKASYIGDAVFLAREFERLRAEQAIKLADAKALAAPKSASARLKVPAQVNLDELEILLSPPAALSKAAEERPPAQFDVAASVDMPVPAPSGLLPAQPDRKPEPKAETPAPETVESAPKGTMQRWLDRFRRKPR